MLSIGIVIGNLSGFIVHQGYSLDATSRYQLWSLREFDFELMSAIGTPIPLDITGGPTVALEAHRNGIYVCYADSTSVPRRQRRAEKSGVTTACGWWRQVNTPVAV